jgi:hypothetical protein
VSEAVAANVAVAAIDLGAQSINGEHAEMSYDGRRTWRNVTGPQIMCLGRVSAKGGWW